MRYINVLLTYLLTYFTPPKTWTSKLLISGGFKHNIRIETSYKNGNEILSRRISYTFSQNLANFGQ